MSWGGGGESVEGRESIEDFGLDETQSENMDEHTTAELASIMFTLRGGGTSMHLRALEGGSVTCD